MFIELLRPAQLCRRAEVAGAPGFEPGLTDPKSAELPLFYAPSDATASAHECRTRAVVTESAGRSVGDPGGVASPRDPVCSHRERDCTRAPFAARDLSPNLAVRSAGRAWQRSAHSQAGGLAPMVLHTCLLAWQGHAHPGVHPVGEVPRSACAVKAAAYG